MNWFIGRVERMESCNSYSEKQTRARLCLLVFGYRVLWDGDMQMQNDEELQPEKRGMKGA
jgi:hypothetical protein